MTKAIASKKQVAEALMCASHESPAEYPHDCSKCPFKTMASQEEMDNFRAQYPDHTFSDEFFEGCDSDGMMKAAALYLMQDVNNDKKMRALAHKPIYREPTDTEKLQNLLMSATPLSEAFKELNDAIAAYPNTHYTIEQGEHSVTARLKTIGGEE